MGGFKHSGVTTSSGGSSRSEYTASAVVQDGAILDAGDTAGTTTAYTATLSPAIAAYANKQLFRVKFNATFGATPTINFNSVGAKKMYYMLAGTATQLTTSNVPANYVGELRYDTSLDTAAGAFLLLNPPAELFTAITNSAITALAAETTLATDDLIIISDTSEGAANKMTVANLFNFFVGTIHDYGGSSAPTGWLLCYGQNVSRTTYAALFAKISTTFGTGDGSTTFGIPDLRGRTTFGKDDMGGSAASRLTAAATGGIDGSALGNVGGEQSHTQTTTELRAHTHSESASNSNNLSVGAGGGSANSGVTGTTTGSTGSSAAANVVNPGIVLNKIIFSGV